MEASIISCENKDGSMFPVSHFKRIDNGSAVAVAPDVLGVAVSVVVDSGAALVTMADAVVVTLAHHDSLPIGHAHASPPSWGLHALFKGQPPAHTAVAGSHVASDVTDAHTIDVVEAISKGKHNWQASAALVMPATIAGVRLPTTLIDAPSTWMLIEAYDVSFSSSGHVRVTSAKTEAITS
jgi:hypothetical protein